MSKAFYVAMALVFLTNAGCAVTAQQASCVKNASLIQASNCSSDQKSKLMYALVSGCEAPDVEAFEWSNELNALPQPLECEEIPKANFQYSWNETKKLKHEEKLEEKGAGGAKSKKGCMSARIVKQQLLRVQSQAKYCYEKQLPSNPTLAGKIRTSFKIGASGEVIEAVIQETTMYHYGLENCLLKVIESLRFPECKHGGTGLVSYPWVFETRS